MAFDPINIGTTPDDNTGDPNRTAFGKCNVNFLELFTGLAACVLGTDYVSALGTINESLADIATELAGKADAGSIGDVVSDSEIIHKDTDQVVTPDDRYQFVENSGSYVTIPFELLPSSTPLEGTFNYDLPRFPFDFMVKDAWITAHLTSLTSLTDLLVNGNIKQNAGTNIIELNPTGMAIDGTVAMNVVAPLRKLLGKQKLTAMFNFDQGISYVGFAQGFTLWLRGVWLA